MGKRESITVMVQQSLVVGGTNHLGGQLVRGPFWQGASGDWESLPREFSVRPGWYLQADGTSLDRLRDRRALSTKSEHGL